MTRSLNIEELTTAAHRIVLGTVRSVEEERIPGKAPALVATLTVSETYKGSVASTVTIRQLARIGPRGRLAPFMDIPRFHAGERVVVFLTGESGLGLSSPVGLGQGVFRVMGKRKDLSQSRIVNGTGNRSLFERAATPAVREFARAQAAGGTPTPGSRLTLGDLKRLIRGQTETKP